MKVHSFQRLCHNMLIDIHVNICLISWLYPRINLYRYRQISVAWNQQKLFVCLCLQALLEYLSPSWWQEHQGLAGAIFNLCRKGPHVFSQWWLNILHALTTSKSGNRKPTNSSSLIVLMHARLMVLSAHVQRENLLWLMLALLPIFAILTNRIIDSENEIGPEVKQMTYAYGTRRH